MRNKRIIFAIGVLVGLIAGASLFKSGRILRGSASATVKAGYAALDEGELAKIQDCLEPGDKIEDRWPGYEYLRDNIQNVTILYEKPENGGRYAVVRVEVTLKNESVEGIDLRSYGGVHTYLLGIFNGEWKIMDRMLG